MSTLALRTPRAALGALLLLARSEAVAQEAWLSRYAVEADVRPVTLPRPLDEASGLTATADGRVLAHNDEEGVLYQVDAVEGKIVKRFSLGSFGVSGDFEGIARRGEAVYLVTSKGELYEFREGGDRQQVQFRVYRTGLDAGNDVEGLCYDPAGDCLLLLCKGDPGHGLKGVKAAYAFDLKAKRLLEPPRLLIRLKEITVTEPKKFNPSDIALHPVAGTFFVISAEGGCIVEVARDGTVLAQRRLSAKVNRHPEGITFLPEGTMLICNDGQGGRGSLVRYPLRSR
jgi:uncharacterized protein YjiK